MAKRVHRRPVWGTCAGLILLAESANRTKKGGQDLIGGLDVRVNRNHFGRQAESFVTDLDLTFLEKKKKNDDRTLGDSTANTLASSHPFKGIFIRAPVVETVLPSRCGEHDRQEQASEEREDSVMAPMKQPRDPHALNLARSEVEVMATLPKPGIQKTAGPLQDGPQRHRGDIIAVRQGNVFGTSFHPELSGDPRMHRWWLEEVLGLVETMHLVER